MPKDKFDKMPQNKSDREIEKRFENIEKKLRFIEEELTVSNRSNIVTPEGLAKLIEADLKTASLASRVSTSSTSQFLAPGLLAEIVKEIAKELIIQGTLELGKHAYEKGVEDDTKVEYQVSISKPCGYEEDLEVEISAEVSSTTIRPPWWTEYIPNYKGETGQEYYLRRINEEIEKNSRIAEEKAKQGAIDAIYAEAKKIKCKSPCKESPTITVDLNPEITQKAKCVVDPGAFSSTITCSAKAKTTGKVLCSK